MFRLILVLLLLASVNLRAEEQARRGPPAGWSPCVKGGAVWVPETDLDGGGDFALARFYLEGAMAYLFRTDRMVLFSSGVGRDSYHFSGLTSEPWIQIDSVRLGAFVRWALSDNWMLIAAPSIRASAEKGAGFGGAWTGGFFSGFSYKINEKLSIGPGFGVMSQIKDKSTAFPVLVVNWKVTDQLVFKTGGGMAASRGPGLTLEYKIDTRWRTSISGRYESHRFVLNQAGRIGEDESFGLMGAIDYVPNPGMQFSLFAGYTIGGELRTENYDGQIINETEYDNAPSIGGLASLRF